MLDCVLFDLDGLLVDSEPLQYRAYHYAFEQFGIHLSMDDWIRWHSVEASTARWVEREQLDLDVQLLREVKKQRYEQLIATELKLKPGVREPHRRLCHGLTACSGVSLATRIHRSLSREIRPDSALYPSAVG